MTKPKRQLFAHDPRFSRATVYYILNRLTNRIYIGQSGCAARRCDHHYNDLQAGRHHNAALQEDWNSFGPEAFEFGPLVDGESGLFRAPLSRHELERIFISVYQSGDPRLGYNNDASTVSSRRFLGVTAQDFIREYGDDSYWGQQSISPAESD